MSPDPIGFAGGDTNLYRYVGNNPISFSDPLGLKYTNPADGATAAYKDMFTGNFIPATQVVPITPYQAAIGIAALPAVGALGSLAVAAGPSIAAYGMIAASNPGTIINALDFADSLSGELGGPTTGLPSLTYGGAAGTFMGMGIQQYKNSCGP